MCMARQLDGGYTVIRAGESSAGWGSALRRAERAVPLGVHPLLLWLCVFPWVPHAGTDAQTSCYRPGEVLQSISRNHSSQRPSHQTSSQIQGYTAASVTGWGNKDAPRPLFLPVPFKATSFPCRTLPSQPWLGAASFCN